MSVTEAWTRIDTLLAAKYPLIYATMKPGATEEDLGYLNGELPVTAPEALRESLRVHNGQKDPHEEHGLFDHFVLLSSSQIPELYHLIRISRTKWKKQWIPFARRGENYIVVEAVSEEARAGGRVLVVEDDQASEVGSSFESWLEHQAERITLGDHQLAWWKRTWKSRWGKTNAFSSLVVLALFLIWGVFNSTMLWTSYLPYQIPNALESFLPGAIYLSISTALWRLCGARTGPLAFFLAGVGITTMVILGLMIITWVFHQLHQLI